MSSARVAAGALLALLGVVCGCTAENRYRVRFASDPPGAPIAIVHPTRIDLGVSGVRTLGFSAETPTYLVEATPGGALQNYKPTRFEVRRADVHFLPVRDGVRTCTIKLLRKEYLELPAWDLLCTPGRGMMALRTWSRAYESVVEEDGKAVEPVMPLRDCDGVRGIALSPRADRIVYAAFVVKPAPAAHGRTVSAPELAELEYSQLRSFTVQNASRQAVTSGQGIDIDPSFGGGEGLLYSANRDRFTLYDLYRLHPAGPATALTSELDGRSALWPAGGPGDLVAFSLQSPSDRSLSDARLCVQRDVEAGFAVIESGIQPSLSPDGTRVAYIKEGDLYHSGIDGASPVRLTSDAGELRAAHRASLNDDTQRDRFDRLERDWLFLAHSSPVWTPDGRWIVFTTMRYRDSDGRPSEDLAAVSLKTGREVRLTSNPSADRHPMISGDGRSLFFLSNRGKQWAVWRVDMPVDLKAD